MRIGANSFRGEAPRLTPRELPENAAQSAVNARLQSGDLESWRQFVLAKSLANPDDVETIYLLNDQWLSWSADVDVARGVIPGDNTYRVYLTGPDLYEQPRFTNYALATTGAEPYPVATRPLGVPAPDAQPTLVAGVSSQPTSTTIEVIDSGDQIDESWSVNPPISGGFTTALAEEDPAVGNGQPGYRLQADENAGSPAYLYRDFGVGESQVVEFSFDFRFNSASRRRLQANVLASATGAGVFVQWTEAGLLQVGISSGWSNTGLSALDAEAIGAPAADGRWYTCQGSIVINASGTKTVRAAIYEGSAQLGNSVTVTNAFTNSGGYFGFVLEIGDDAPAAWQTWIDNILVRGTSPTDALTQTATSYVVTFVNDLGEESAPSPASATILKDDGTAITVTTQTSVPSGFSVDYAVETKRIYRAVTGNTGTIFAFVAEIPLSQADYVDELTDSELGDALETELWDLPPDDLRGILALPNGIMVGFRRNQLCLSVQNRPHAWPVQWRLNTDTDIVAIGNIDNTVVIGTEAFPYLAVGNDPSAYSMSKLEVPQACVSKRSLAYLTNIGVVFASPDGLIAVSGNGRPVNLTEQIFTRRQWQELLPHTIRGIAHDDVYHFWYGVESATPPVAPELPLGIVTDYARVVISDTSRYLAWPVVTRLADGRLFLGYTDASSHHLDNDGAAVGRFSSDEGATWGAQFTIYDDASLFATVYGVSQVASGRIFAALWRDNALSAGTGEAGLVYSDDNGVTWSAWVSLDAASGFTQESYSAGPVVELSNGDLVMTVEGTFTGQTPIVEESSRLIRSTDGGLTWGSPVNIALYTTYSRAHYESKLVLLPSGVLLCLHRTTNGPGTVYINKSTDNGLTWGTPVAVFPGYGAPSTTRLANGTLVSVLRRNADAAVSVYMSYDDGLTWTEETIIDATMTQSEYGAPVEIAGDRILVVYGSQPTSALTNSDIKQAELVQLFAPMEGFAVAGGTATTENAGATAFTTGAGAARSAVGRSSGHYYFEMTLQIGDDIALLGLVRATATLASYPGVDADGYAYYGDTGQRYNNNVGVAYGSTFTVGDVIGVEYDNGNITFYKNGVSQGVAFSGVSGELFPAYGPGSVAAVLRGSSLNLGYWDFRHTLPVGAVAWKG